MSKNCLGNITVPTTPGLIVQYSVTGTGGWSTTATSSSKYIRFSTNNGQSYSTAIKFVGDNGTNGTDGTSTSILYNNLTSIGVESSGVLETALTYNLPANTLITNGDCVKVTIIGEAPTGNKDITVKLCYVDTNSTLATCTLQGILTAYTNVFKIETTINRTAGSNFFAESVVYQSGNPGAILDSPSYTTGTRDLTTILPLLVTIKDDTNPLVEATTYIKMVRVEYLPKI